MSRKHSATTQKSQGPFWDFAEFSARLRQERLRTGLNQKDFGEIAGVTLDSQNRYENAKTKPDAQYLALLAGAGVDVQYVLTGRRVEGASLSRETSELIGQLERLPQHLREAALGVVKALTKAAAPAPAGPTFHAQNHDYRAEDGL